MARDDTLGGGPEAVFSQKDKDGGSKKSSVCTKRCVVFSHLEPAIRLSVYKSSKEK